MTIPVFVPVASFPRQNVVNQTIVYSDTVLNLKEKGLKLKITSVDDVSEYNFERCLKIILDENPDVIFNTIQYSQNDKKVYFYTDKPIVTTKWEERDKVWMHYIENRAGIIDYIEKVLEIESIDNPDLISIYDIWQFTRKEDSNFDAYQKEMEALMNSKLKRINDQYHIVLYGSTAMDEQGFNLAVAKRYVHLNADYENFKFKKNGDDLYITEKKGFHLLGNKVFDIIGDEISEAYDYWLKREKLEKVYEITSVNTDFQMNISRFGVTSIRIRKFKDFKFELYSFKNEATVDCNSNKIALMMLEHRDDICKKIFVKISDCPTWMQEELRTIRTNQLLTEAEERRRLEEKEKRRNFLKKIFPFLK